MPKMMRELFLDILKYINNMLSFDIYLERESVLKTEQIKK